MGEAKRRKMAEQKDSVAPDVSGLAGDVSNHSPWADDSENWEPEKHPDYNYLMPLRCAAIEARLLAASDADKRAFLADTRPVHAELYDGLTPLGRAEYAGTYRGTANSSIEHYWPAINLVINGSEQPPVVTAHPLEVDGKMNAYAAKISTLQTGRDKNTTYAAIVARWLEFNQIHPYANGNGHISRLMVTVMGALTGHPLANTWTIHPSPLTDDAKLALANSNTREGLLSLARFILAHSL